MDDKGHEPQTSTRDAKRSLALTLVPGFGRGLRRLPPRTVLGVPFDRLREARLEVGVLRSPTQLGAQLGRIDRVPTVMARTILHPIERILRLPHHPQNHAKHGDVIPLTIRADQIRLADTTLRQNRPHAAGMVLGMDPVTHVQPLAVQLRTLTIQDVRDLTRDELLHMLIRAIIVRAVRDRRADPVRARPRAHQHVRRRLRRTVRAGRMIRRMLREPGRIIQREIPVHLVRAHMMVTDPILPDRLQQAERALNIRPEERLRIRDAVVIMRLGGVMHDRVMARHDTVQQIRIADVTHDQFHTVLGQARDVLRIARVRELVQHGHMHVRMVFHHVMHEIRPDETTATGHDDVLGSKRLFIHTPDFTTPHLFPLRMKLYANFPEGENVLCTYFIQTLPNNPELTFAYTENFCKLLFSAPSHHNLQSLRIPHPQIAIQSGATPAKNNGKLLQKSLLLQQRFSLTFCHFPLFSTLQKV